MAMSIYTTRSSGYVYISVAAVAAGMGSALTASPFKVFDKIPQNASQGNEIDVGRSSSAV